MKGLSSLSLHGLDAAHLFRVLSLARARNLPLLPTVEVFSDLPGVPRLRRLLPLFRAGGEVGLLDAIESALKAGPDSCAAGMLAALRRAGLPHERLKEMSAWFSARARLRSRLFAAVLYPFSFAVAGALVYVILIHGLLGPLFGQMFNHLLIGLGADRPFVTRLVLGFWGVPARLLGNPLTGSIYIVALLVLAAWAVYIVSTMNRRGLALVIPLAGQFVRLCASREFCGSLALLLRSGAPAGEAVALAAATVENVRLSESRATLSPRIQQGESLGEMLRTHEATRGVVGWRLWAAYYRNDLLPELESTASSLERELRAIERRLTSTSTALAWICAFFALLPLWLSVWALYLPMFDLISKIG